MKSAVQYIFIIFIIFINLLFFKYININSLNLILLTSLFNILTFPILYLFMSIETIASIPSLKYNNFNNQNSKIPNKKIKTFNEFFFLLRQPTTLILIIFPYTFILNNSIDFDISALINIIFILFALFNLIAISILVKSLYIKNYSILITVIGILFSITSTTVHFSRKNILNITLFLTVFFFLTILLIYHINKKAENE